jgi:hypothetical protein
MTTRANEKRVVTLAQRNVFLKKMEKEQRVFDVQSMLQILWMVL